MIHSLSSPPIIILAIDDLRLLRMKLQSAFSKALLKRIFEDLRLRLTYAMAESVVSEPFKGNVRMIPGHPPVERVMQKQVAQQG
jgi:hypothetical protein